jgi:hypothetical protein
MARRKKRVSQRKKAAVEAMRNKEMGICKASRVFNLPQTKLQRHVKGRQESSSEAIKQNWVGSKFFLVKYKMMWLSIVCLLMERKCLSLKMAKCYAFIGPLKTFYCQEIEKELRSNLGRVVTFYQIGEQFGNAYSELRQARYRLKASGRQASFLMTRTPSNHTISHQPQSTQMLLL